MSKLLQHSATNPFHISVGAVVVNNEGKILVHTLTKESVPRKHQATLGGLESALILMRESVENDESLEAAVLRGVNEEFGVSGTILRYLGSTRYMLPDVYGMFEKTTLYFLVHFTKQKVRVSHDWESHTSIEWMEPEVIIERMKEQGQRTEREDLDESKILETYVACR